MPGSAHRRLLDAAVVAFERDGFEAAGVIDMAAAAGVTTGSLYHHFGSKLGLFQVIRREMERRIRDRLEGAFAATEGGRSGVTTALLVGFDAATRLKVARILSESPPGVTEDTLIRALVELIAPAPAPTPGPTPEPTPGPTPAAAPAAAAPVMLGAWRAALASVASGEPVVEVRVGLAWTLGSSDL